MNTPSKTFTADALPVRVYASQADLARDAAEAVRQYMQQVIREHGRAFAILASAASQEKFLDALTALDGIEWSKITLFHMDEYLGITRDHPASFRRFLRERVEQRVHPHAFHCIEGEAQEPLKEIARYASLLKAHPIDLCCLGIGENGHIAFNDPPVADFHDPQVIKLVQLDLKCRQQQVGEGAFPNLDAVPKFAYTLTIPELCAAKKMVCIVPERRKAEAVRDALKGPITTACPASILRKHSQCTLYLDADSASLL